jgi:hypothetical protein
MILTTFGLFCGGIALHFKNLYILYILCALPCGFGGLAIYQRLVFIHQLWFKKIGKQNIGMYCTYNFLSYCVELFYYISLLIVVYIVLLFPCLFMYFIYYSSISFHFLNMNTTYTKSSLIKNISDSHMQIQS